MCHESSAWTGHMFGASYCIDLYMLLLNLREALAGCIIGFGISMETLFPAVEIVCKDDIYSGQLSRVPRRAMCRCGASCI